MPKEMRDMAHLLVRDAKRYGISRGGVVSPAAFPASLIFLDLQHHSVQHKI